MPEITIKSAIWAQALSPEYRYIFIKGGRASGKSHEVGQYLVERSATEADLKIVCLREVQKSIKRSSKSLIDDKIESFGISHAYKSIEGEIRKEAGKDAGMFYFAGMNDLTADNIKSLEGFKIAWFEEAQNASYKTLKTLRPTIRMAGSQLIFTWNPKFPDDPIEEFCNEMRDEPDCLIIHVNYEDNPFLSDEVLREVEIDREKSPDDFEHIWLGQYDQSFHGYHYAKLILQAENEGRISSVPHKSGVDYITAWDLGKRDATAIWVCQKVGLEYRVVDYYENNFEELDHYTAWLKENGYNDYHYLPFDGGHERLGMRGSIKDQLKSMGLKHVRVLDRLSEQAGMALGKALIKECYFDSKACKEGLRALKNYRSEYDEKKKIYKHVHDWASHGADAFRYLAQALEKHNPEIAIKKVSFQIDNAGLSYMGV